MGQRLLMIKLEAVQTNTRELSHQWYPDNADEYDPDLFLEQVAQALQNNDTNILVAWNKSDRSDIIHAIPSQLSLGERWCTPWTDCQSIAGPTHIEKQPFTPMNNLESSVNLHVFGLREEAGVHGQNLLRHKKSKPGSQTQKLLAVSQQC